MCWVVFRRERSWRVEVSWVLIFSSMNICETLINYLCAHDDVCTVPACLWPTWNCFLTLNEWLFVIDENFSFSFLCSFVFMRRKNQLSSLKMDNYNFLFSPHKVPFEIHHDEWMEIFLWVLRLFFFVYSSFECEVKLEGNFFWM